MAEKHPDDPSVKRAVRLVFGTLFGPLFSEVAATRPENSSLQRHARLVVGTFVGGVVGFLAGAPLGFWLVWFLGPKVFGPDFAQVGWIIALFVSTYGGIQGASTGCTAIFKQRGLFVFCLLPLAVFFVGLLSAHIVLRNIDRPRHFAFTIHGPPGAAYIGAVLVDGEQHNLEGVLPDELEYDGIRVELALVLQDLNFNGGIGIDAFANGRKLGEHAAIPTGMYLQLKSVGYSETFGGTNVTRSELTRLETQRLAKDRAIPVRRGL